MIITRCSGFIGLFMSIFLLSSCRKNNNKAPDDPFQSTPQSFPLAPPGIPEASGIADSKLNPGYIWVEQDSGNPPELFLLSHLGIVLKTVHLNNTVNRDWEDMLLAPGPQQGKNYLYIADIGDNNSQRTDYVIYRLEEPLLTSDTVSNAESIRFQYPDAAHDAEAFLVDGDTKDIYIITKRDNKSKVYRIAYPQDTSVINTASFIADLPYNGVVSAALSGDGRELLIKTYTAIYFYQRTGSTTLDQLIQSGYTSLPYVAEPQGEAICFAEDGSGFYTLSEKGIASSTSLYFYPRK